ncbi:MAG: type I-E CRISPR-associated protein Cas6/Cse3/CasE [Clostridiales bacterium]|jgi:CRISPR system Cascade subunit CasE|nr:type I-E CRISPR-associated protein Cas6/Cse3/CasE [Clostridiales bacterium]
MFLSRIELNTKQDKTKRAIANPNMIHAAIESCFPKREEGNERKLWRLDKLNDKLYLLILSAEQPDFKDFIPQFSPQDALGEVKDYTPLLERMEQGQIWRFRLCANAVRSVAEVNGERGKIYAHVTIGYQREWLLKRSERYGFLLKDEDFEVVQSSTVKFRRRGENALATISMSVYEGLLTVSDPLLFREALTGGIGRAKAYGCGLITVAGTL